MSSTRDDGDKTASRRREEFPSLMLKVPCLVVVEGPSIGLEVALDQSETIIGRVEHVGVSLDDKLVSREHAKVVAEGERPDYFLVDNGSTNGTFLNSEKIDRVALKEGDKVQVGNTILRFSFHDEVDVEYHRRIFDLITYDELTGLLTLRPFYRELERELARSERLGLPVSVLMMDLDHFKDVNDTHGHQMGSHVLGEVGRLIRQTLRYNDPAARYGGEEFIAFLPNTIELAAMGVGDDIREAISRHDFAHQGGHAHITISVGVAAYPSDGVSVESLIRSADQALYVAKRRGRDRVKSYASDVFQVQKEPIDG